MCGIAGYIETKDFSEEIILQRMIESLKHRGPDGNDKTFYNFANSRIGLAHSRLSIIDLSENAKQPMVFNNLTIIFNGEIYNFQEIKNNLESIGHTFTTKSDTEVILHAYFEFGIKCIDLFVGMFSIVILDKESKELVLISDRACTKPLYYYWDQSIFIFASELKAIHQHPFFVKEIDKSSLYLFFTKTSDSYIPAPKSIFKNTFKSEQASILKFNLLNSSISITKYWNVREYYEKPKLKITYNEAKEVLLDKLNVAFNYRMVSDVPVGVFLSGGYDSTAVAGILQKDRTDKIKTFTIGFEGEYNEANFAQKTASYLGTDHHELSCDINYAQNLIPDLPKCFDEPFGDISAIPTMLLCKLARTQVKVALSGDGGDELLGGYNNYQKILNINNKLVSTPNFIKNGLRFALGNYKFNNNFNSKLINKLDILNKSLNKNINIQAYLLFKNSSSTPNKVIDNLLTFTSTETKLDISNINNLGNCMDAIFIDDYNNYLSYNSLTKIDRSSMFYSLEGRDPFVDHNLTEFCAQLPIEYKIKNNSGKFILKDLVHEIIPQKFMDREKQGFNLPIYKWLNNELSYLLEEYINEKELQKHGFFNIDFVMSIKNLFINKKLHNKSLIWKILVFQMWYKTWMEK